MVNIIYAFVNNRYSCALKQKKFKKQFTKLDATQPTFTCSKSAIETLEKDVKRVQSEH